MQVPGKLEALMLFAISAMISAALFANGAAADEIVAQSGSAVQGYRSNNPDPPGRPRHLVPDQVYNSLVREMNRQGVNSFTAITGDNEDCTATVTCADGKPLKCSLTGPGHCGSGTGWISCWSTNDPSQNGFCTCEHRDLCPR